MFRSPIYSGAPATKKAMSDLATKIAGSLRKADQAQKGDKFMGEIPGEVPQKMKFTKVETYEMSGGIPLDGFRINKDRGAMPSVEFAIKKLAELRGTDKRFVYKILNKEGKLKKPGRSIRQGFDPFNKLSLLDGVRITRYPCVLGHEDAYLLELEAREDHELESKLAERLGSKQALQSKVINVEFEAEGDDGEKFRVDCDDIASRLQGMYAELQPEDTESLCIQERLEGPQPKAPLTGRTILYTFLSERYP